jgi:ribonuclease III
MATRARPALADLETRLGYRFVDNELARRALSHISFFSAGGLEGRLGSYERLEFLGDRVLGLVVAEMLYEAFPQATEGELSIRLAALVRRETCAEVAAEWDLGPHLSLGAGEAQAGGRKKATILADVCESLIGAIFLDGGFIAAREAIAGAWAPRMRAVLSPARDAKTLLQEWAQARSLGAPSYEEIGRSGPDHAPKFTVRVSLRGYEPEVGAASSKRAAEQAAAGAFMSRREQAS